MQFLYETFFIQHMIIYKLLKVITLYYHISKMLSRILYSHNKIIYIYIFIILSKSKYIVKNNWRL